MNKVVIGLNSEIAIIIEQTKPRAGTYVAKKAVMGKYNIETNSFTTIDGDTYNHFLEYKPDCKEREYFIGHFPITGFVRNIYNKNTNLFLLDYLKTFQRFKYQKRVDDIICQDINTNQRFIFEDDIVKISEIIKESVFEALTDYNQMVTEAMAENSEKEDNNKLSTNISSQREVTNNQTTKKIIPIQKSIKDLEKEVNEYVKGQDEAVRKIITNIYEYKTKKSSQKNNMLLIGPSGVGKTYILETLAKIFEIPITIYSIKDLSDTGYKGGDIEDVFIRAYNNCHGNIEKLENSIIVLDELDKIAKRNDDSGVTTSAVQDILLNTIEGKYQDINLGREKGIVTINTKNILFVATGAFQEIFKKAEKIHGKVGFKMTSENAEEQVIKNNSDSIDDNTITEKVISYGIKTELAGRFNTKVILNNLTIEDLYNIIINGKNNNLQSKIETYKECGVNITNINDIVHSIAENAIKKGTGARGIRDTVESLFYEISYEIMANPGKYDTLTLGPNFLTNHKDYQLFLSEPQTTHKVKKLETKCKN